ncbi:MAG TPA: MBL fold metallo-hydrolase [Methylococcaceae bacterium]|nr:MBL fold metallo-hydrolase [Methylococcaceae bacterium]
MDEHALMLRHVILPVTEFQQNCTLLWCEETRRGAVVDPGGEITRIRREIERQEVAVEKILLTHGHIDHAAGAPELAKALGVPVEGPQPEDAFWLQNLPQQSTYFGLPPAAAFEPDRWLENGDRVAFGRIELEVLHCPGHTPGHLVYFDPASKLALVGDVLFKGSIGRSDFPRGDHAALLRSIRKRLFPLGDEVRFVSGHGPMSTFGEERRRNPFVADSRFS